MRGKVPVFGKHISEIADGWSQNFEMGIPPVSQIRIFTQILFSDVHPANKTRFAVHNKDFAVVSQIDLNAAAKDVYRQERRGSSACLNQRFKG